MFAAFSSGNMMQVLIIAIFLGISVVFMPEQYRIPVKAWFVNMSELFMSVINLIMAFSPIGVFAIMAAAIGENGLATFTAMGKMLGTFYLACLIQIIIVNLILLWITTEVTPFDFIRKSAKTWLAAMSTCSSAAVIPVNLDVADKEFRVSDKVSSFTIPFGVPFNQDGGAILSAVVILFSAQAIGIQFGFVELIRMVLICTIVSAGSAAVPGGGIVRLMITSAAFGMPLEIVMLVAAFYRLFDMGTTTMCCIGDLSATIIIDRFERRREMKTAGNS
jgi:Na+/H+-dicarboxylate symporter